MTPIRARMLAAGAKLGMTANQLDGHIYTWLDNYLSCPWPGERCSLCDAAFPHLRRYKCPCTQFGLSYVRRRAREALEE